MAGTRAIVVELTGVLMRERRSRSERVTGGTCSTSSPVEMLSSGAATGVWLLDPSSSRIQVWAPHFRRFVSLRAEFDSFNGRIEIGGSVPIWGSLTVDASSVRCRRAWPRRKAFGEEFFVTLDDPTVTFQSEHVFLVAPDQAWVVGTLAGGEHHDAVAFEASVKLDFPYARAVVDATIVPGNLPFLGGYGPRRLARATCTLHLSFLRQY